MPKGPLVMSGPFFYCLMPYELVGNCIHIKGDPEPIEGGCHEDHESAMAHLLALEINVEETKMEQTEMTKTKPDGNFSYFIPITKVDVEKRQIWCFASKEEPDNSGEIMDYRTSKPYFLDWSNRAFKRSGGKSKGNVRAMHQLITAGKLFDLQAVDEDRGFYVGIDVIDNDEWRKVQEGVYTGVSIGGRYIKRWPDRQYIRFTAEPHELSLVDVPMLSSATFDVIKADEVEQRTFQIGTGQIRLDLIVNDDEEVEKIDDATPAPTQIEPVTISQVIAGQPYEQIQPQQKTLEVDLDSPPDGQQLMNVSGPAIDLSTMAAPIVEKQSTPTDQVGKKAKISKPKIRSIKVTKKNDVKKADIANLVESMQGMAASLQEQKKTGEVDQALLDQISSALEVAADYVGDMEGKIAAEMNSTASSLGESIETKVEPSPSVPSAPSSPSPAPSAAPSPVPVLNRAGGGPSPMPMKPPEFMIVGQGQDELEFKVAPFTKAMLNNNLREAEELAFHSQPTFDKLFNMACHRTLDEMGFTAFNFQQGGLMKAIAAPNMPGVALLPLARLMYPVYAGLSRRLPTQSPPIGSNVSTWRANLGFGALAFAQFLRVAEGAVGPAMAEAFLTFNAPYRDVSIYDQVTLNATAAS